MTDFLTISTFSYFVNICTFIKNLTFKSSHQSNDDVKQSDLH